MEEKTFELKITNGAAKRLETLMQHFGVDEKKALSIALELLDIVKDAKSVQFVENGEEETLRGVSLPPKAPTTRPSGEDEECVE